MLERASLKSILNRVLVTTITKGVKSLNVIISYLGHSINISDEFKIKNVIAKILLKEH